MRWIAGKMHVRLILVTVLLLSCLLFGCAPAADTQGIQIITTSFPAYDFARVLTKDCEGVEVRMLLSPGTESHSYDPSAADMMAVQDASLFIYIGQGSDLWAERMMDAVGHNTKTFALTDGLQLLSLEEDHEGHGHEEKDPHVWTSPVNAMSIVGRLADTLCALPHMSSENCARIEVAETAYMAQLTALDRDFRTLSESLSEEERILVFGDRFPFRYFAGEYGFSYLAAFPGCSEESEPSAATVTSIIDTVREKNIQTIFYVEFSEHRIADTIAVETGVSTACLHSCHNVTRDEFDQGESYLTLMQKNLDCLNSCLK